MFTIKHESNNVGTTLVQAKFFASEKRSDGYTQFLAYNETRDDYVATWCADECSAPTDSVLYVMNESGATVAVHRFNSPRFATMAA